MSLDKRGVTAGLLLTALVSFGACQSSDDFDVLHEESQFQSPGTRLVREYEVDRGSRFEMLEYAPGPGLVRVYDVRDSTPALERRWYEVELRQLGWQIGRHDQATTSFSKSINERCLGFVVSELAMVNSGALRERYPDADLVITIGLGSPVGRCGTPTPDG